MKNLILILTLVLFFGCKEEDIIIDETQIIYQLSEDFFTRFEITDLHMIDQSKLGPTEKKGIRQITIYYIEDYLKNNSLSYDYFRFNLTVYLKRSIKINTLILRGSYEYVNFIFLNLPNENEDVMFLQIEKSFNRTELYTFNQYKFTENSTNFHVYPYYNGKPIFPEDVFFIIDKKY
jgi:hypothetical protein